jgi:hypothetical protein
MLTEAERRLPEEQRLALVHRRLAERSVFARKNAAAAQGQAGGAAPGQGQGQVRPPAPGQGGAAQTPQQTQQQQEQQQQPLQPPQQKMQQATGQGSGQGAGQAQVQAGQAVQGVQGQGQAQGQGQGGMVPSPRPQQSPSLNGGGMNVQQAQQVGLRLHLPRRHGAAQSWH